MARSELGDATSSWDSYRRALATDWCLELSPSRLICLQSVEPQLPLSPEASGN